MFDALSQLRALLLYAIMNAINPSLQEAVMGLLNLLKKRLSPSKLNIEVSASYPSLEEQIVPIETRVKSMKPIVEGLYVHEVLVLSYAETFTPSQREFQQFWWWRYGIKDLRGLVDSLQERGFIAIGGPESAVRASKVPELREFLKAHGLKVSGKKEELIERVFSEADPASTENFFRETTYVLTSKGKAVLEANQAVIEAHKDPLMSIWDVSECDLNRPQKSDDERWGEMNAAYIGFAASGDFGQARDMRDRKSVV